MAQDSTQEQSKFQKFINESGRLIKITETNLDRTGTTKINLQKATDLQTNEVSKSLILYEEVNALFGGKVTISGIYIDEEEVPGFTKALKYIQTQIENKPEILDTKFIYTTTNGVVLSATFGNVGYNKTGWTVSVKQVYKYSRLSIPYLTIDIKTKDVTNLVISLEAINSKSFQ